MSPPRESQAEHHKTRWPSPLQIYTTCVSLLGIILIPWSLIRLSEFLPQVLVFIGLIIISELPTSGVFTPQIVFSMSAAVIFAMLLLFGPLPAAFGGLVGGFTATLFTEIVDRRRDRPRAPLVQRAFFNMAALGLPVVFAGGVYLLIGGEVGDFATLANLLPMLLTAALIEFANSGLVVGAVSIQIGKPVFQIWRQNISWATPMNITSMIIGGGGLALGYRIAGLLGLAVFFLPLALTIYAFQMYVRQTKAQMQELEENVAERQRAEEKLKASLQEKEALLQEIHHRVKNNLQVVSSLLYLQAKETKDPETVKILTESQNRVRSMALVHEKLYRAPDLSKINLAQYVQSLVDHLLRSYGVDPNTIHLNNHVDDILLGINTAVPCGLIINELVSNALQHAFPAGQEGQINLELHAGEGGKVVLAISDNGIGFPRGFDFHNTASLGLKLVEILVNQLHGTLELEQNDGTTVRVTFVEAEGRQTTELPPHERSS